MEWPSSGMLSRLRKYGNIGTVDRPGFSSIHKTARAIASPMTSADLEPKTLPCITNLRMRSPKGCSELRQCPDELINENEIHGNPMNARAPGWQRSTKYRALISPADVLRSSSTGSLRLSYPCLKSPLQLYCNTPSNDSSKWRFQSFLTFQHSSIM